MQIRPSLLFVLLLVGRASVGSEASSRELAGASSAAADADRALPSDGVGPAGGGFSTPPVPLLVLANEHRSGASWLGRLLRGVDGVFLTERGVPPQPARAPQTSARQLGAYLEVRCDGEPCITQRLQLRAVVALALAG